MVLTRDTVGLYDPRQHSRQPGALDWVSQEQRCAVRDAHEEAVEAQEDAEEEQALQLVRHVHQGIVPVSGLGSGSM